MRQRYLSAGEISRYQQEFYNCYALKVYYYYRRLTVPQGIYLVLSGLVKTIKLAEDGRELMTGWYKPDEYFGLTALLLDEDFTKTAEISEDSAVCLLPREAILNLINWYP